ncbi:MAG: flp pilus-assembly TadE/G-like family protein [Acidobacteria bacterium]|nr:flp pilus-assembly TadE/G-like family protein [Acidobacteriota bacterium]
MSIRHCSFPQREAGAGTVLLVGLVSVALALILVVLLLVQAATGAQRAATAADLAALAAADAARGLVQGQPCQLAGEVAARHEATVTRCAITGASQDVAEVDVSLPLPGLLGAATGRARAGPPPEPTP